jgi:TetR/AcrR family transcriptional regulator
VSTNPGKQEQNVSVDSGQESGRMSADARRRQLIEVAISLFSQKGFRGTTTKEIALAARVNEAIIFRHFATKEDLYTAILDYKAGEVRVDEWLEEFKRHAERRDDEALFRSFAHRIIDRHRHDMDFLRLMLYSALEGHELARNFHEKQFKPINEFFNGYIARRQREGAFRAGNPKIILQAFIGMIVNHVLTTRLFDFESIRISDKEAVKSFPLLLLDGLRLAPASETDNR